MKKPEDGKKLIGTDLGEFLKLQRKAKDVSRNKVKNDTGVNESTLAHIEKGKIKIPNLDTLYKLSQYYNFDLNVLLRQIEYPGIASEDIKENYIFVKDENEKKAVNTFLKYYREKKSE